MWRAPPTSQIDTSNWRAPRYIAYFAISRVRKERFGSSAYGRLRALWVW